MTERYSVGIKKIVEKLDRGEPLSDHPKTIILSKGDVHLFGFLTENSFVIPLASQMSTNKDISMQVLHNKGVLEKTAQEDIYTAACHSLGLPYNGQINGIYFDGQNFGPLSGIHAYKGENLENSNESFVVAVQKALNSRGTLLNIID
jgi:hypothetical protein